MKLLLCVFAVSLSWGIAQDVQSTLYQPELIVTQLVEKAQDEILLMAPSIYEQALAEALREAIIIRGVDVYLLMSPDEVENRATYVASLQLAGARVRLAEVTENFMVVDRGQVLSKLDPVGAEDPPTSLPGSNSSKDAEVARTIASFYKRFKSASVYTPAFSNTVRREE